MAPGSCAARWSQKMGCRHAAPCGDPDPYRIAQPTTGLVSRCAVFVPALAPKAAWRGVLGSCCMLARDGGRAVEYVYSVVSGGAHARFAGSVSSRWMSRIGLGEGANHGRRGLRSPPQAPGAASETIPSACHARRVVRASFACLGDGRPRCAARGGRINAVGMPSGAR